MSKTNVSSERGLNLLFMVMVLIARLTPDVRRRLRRWAAAGRDELQDLLLIGQGLGAAVAGDRNSPTGVRRSGTAVPVPAVQKAVNQPRREGVARADGV